MLDCPGVTFHFPDFYQNKDFVRYRGYVLSTKEETICAWIEIKKLNTENTILSYATYHRSNELLFYLKSNSEINILIKNQHKAFNTIPFFSTSNQVRKCLSCLKMSKNDLISIEEILALKAIDLNLFFTLISFIVTETAIYT